MKFRFFSSGEETKPRGYSSDTDYWTRGRKIASSLSSKAWYNPSLKIESDEEKTYKPPSLDKAWEFFEHHILPRCLVESPDTVGTSGGGLFKRADIGEHEKQTMLYPVWGTPLLDLADFGVGAGCYFNTLLFLALVTFIAGCLQLPNMIFFASKKYDTLQSGKIDFLSGFKALALDLSAICDSVTWEPCPTCLESDWNTFPSTDDRLAKGINENGDSLFFIKKNNCEVNDNYAMVNLLTLLFIVGAIFFWIGTQRKRIKLFDGAEHSSVDYSIEITNPPSNDASSYDPETWKKWFEDRFEVEVAGVTVALDNEELINLLVERRKLLRKLQDMMPHDEDKIDIDNLEEDIQKCNPVPRWKQILLRASTAESIYFSILRLDAEIDELSKVEYKPASIFVTFQTIAQRNKILDLLVVPIAKRGTIAEEHTYNGTVFKVKKPSEPSAVRWLQLNTPGCIRALKLVLTALLSFFFIVGGGLLVIWVRGSDRPEFASFTITTLNTCTPMIVRAFCSWESHASESSASASKYVKITALRWTNTAIITTFITPFTFSLQRGEGEGLIDFVYTMFWFDLVMTPALQITDIWGNLCRHWFAPRQKTQERMNLQFKSGIADIGERYTNLTRILFFTFFYSSLYPLGFFFASIIFVSNYWFDKFSILRTWQQGPKVGGSVAHMSNFFLLLCLAVYAVMGTYNFWMYPFDNVCENGNVIDKEFHGSWTAMDSNGGALFQNLVVEEDNEEHSFCSQNLLMRFAFPWSPGSILEGSEKWMNDSQMKFDMVYGWVMIAVVAVVGVLIFARLFGRVVYALFYRDYKSDDGDEHLGERFSDINEIGGYVPQVIISGYVYPLLLCDIDNIDEEYLEWCDPYSNYDEHNIIFDIPRIAEAKRKLRIVHADSMVSSNTVEGHQNQEEEEMPCIFSIVKTFEKDSNEQKGFLKRVLTRDRE